MALEAGDPPHVMESHRGPAPVPGDPPLHAPVPVEDWPGCLPGPTVGPASVPTRTRSGRWRTTTGPPGRPSLTHSVKTRAGSTISRPCAPRTGHTTPRPGGRPGNPGSLPWDLCPVVPPSGGPPGGHGTAAAGTGTPEYSIRRPPGAGSGIAVTGRTRHAPTPWGTVGGRIVGDAVRA